MRNFAAILSFLCVALMCVPALARPQYPMKAAEYRKMVSGRVEAVWGRIEKKLEFHNVTPERMKEIRKTFDGAAREVWAEVDKAVADGTVTRQEALRVGALTTALRGKVRGRLAAEKKEASKPPSPAPSRNAPPVPKPPAGKETAKKQAPKPAPTAKAPPAPKPEKRAQVADAPEEFAD
jgi:hypothetical protein